MRILKPSDLFPTPPGEGTKVSPEAIVVDANSEIKDYDLIIVDLKLAPNLEISNNEINLSPLNQGEILRSLLETAQSVIPEPDVFLQGEPHVTEWHE